MRADPPGRGVAVGGASVLLTTDQLVKEYNERKVVNGISVFVNAGEVVACSARMARAKRRLSI